MKRCIVIFFVILTCPEIIREYQKTEPRRSAAPDAGTGKKSLQDVCAGTNRRLLRLYSIETGNSSVSGILSGTAKNPQNDDCSSSLYQVCFSASKLIFEKVNCAES